MGRIAAHEILADHESQNGIAQELELFVISLSDPGRVFFVDAGFMSEGADEQLPVVELVADFGFESLQFTQHQLVRAYAHCGFGSAAFALLRAMIALTRSLPATC